MPDNTTPLKRRSLRIAATALAATLPVWAVTAGPGGVVPTAAAQPGQEASASAEPAVVDGPFDSREAAEKTNYVPAEEAAWRNHVYSDTGRLDKMEEYKVHSPSMNRDIPVVVIRADNDVVNPPTLYLLNGADGGTGLANWLEQTTAADFYGNRVGSVNVVIPMSGAFSYYTDWEQPSALAGGGVQKWETFLTGELPGPMEKKLGTTNQHRAIVGMSMSASSVLVYAEQHQNLYDAVASYSGCPATSGAAASTVDVVLDRGNATYEEMWGDRNGETARRNDALLNVDKLSGQKNIYISSSSGLMGEHDVPSGDRLRGNPVGSVTPAVEGGAIEAVSNVCTHAFKAAADKAGIDSDRNNINWNFRDTGTHQWGYWQDDMFLSWPTLAAGLGLDTGEAEKKARQAAEDYLAANPGVGAAGSVPLLIDTWNNAWEKTYGDGADGNGEGAGA
ncbi:MULTISPECIES: alpha/beta hydrolase [Corynebacterium]|uniref:alpha/beta hydrolase n=1 Tax=Corynebacterium TaxID=1716 RepID=UPI000830F920|nr:MULTISPECIES: alpha/beta hydrolase family protein [Corynebacterium]